MGDVAPVYRKPLAGGGWQATIENPIKTGFKSELIFRNPAEDLLTLSMRGVAVGGIGGIAGRATAGTHAVRNRTSRCLFSTEAGGHTSVLGHSKNSFGDNRFFLYRGIAITTSKAWTNWLEFH